jgi:hypothetical protein
VPNDDATPVIFFLVSVYAFGVVLLYALARAWEQSLSTRSRRGEAEAGKMVSQRDRNTISRPSRTMDARAHREDIRR